MGAWDYCQRGFWHVHKGTRTDGAQPTACSNRRFRSIPISRMPTWDWPVR
jgi:hypothetical protein